MSIRILIVDDSPLFLATAAEILSTYPRIEVVGLASSGGEALDLVDRVHSDLILIDLMMPGMNGLEAARQLRQRPAPPLVIMMSVYDDPEYQREAMTSGVDGFVIKSELIDKILNLIRELLPHLAD